MADDTSEEDQLPKEEKLTTEKIREIQTGTKNECPRDSTCPDSPHMKDHAIIQQAIKFVDIAQRKRGRPKKLIGEGEDGDSPPKNGQAVIKPAIKKCPVDDKAQRKRGRPKKLVAQEKDEVTNIQAVVRDAEVVISHGKKSQKEHSMKRQICTEECKTPCKKKKKMTTSPLFHEPKSLQEIVENVIMNNGIFMSRKSELKDEFVPFIVRSVPTQQENESNYSFTGDMELSDDDEKTGHKREHSDFVNFRQSEKVTYSENCEKKTSDDVTTKWHQPLSLMDACIQQLHRGVDERSYRMLMNYGLPVNATDQQVISSQQKIATSSNAQTNNDTNLESSIDKPKLLSSVSGEECSDTKDNQSNHFNSEGNRDAECNAFRSSLIQKDNLSRNMNSFEALPSNENQMGRTSTGRKTMHNNNDTSIHVELGTGVNRNSKFASEYSDSSRNYLFKDRDEESMLAAELLTRLPHGRIVDSDTSNNAMKLSDIQPTIAMDGNSQTNYFDQQLPFTGHQLVNSTNTGPNQCCYNNMVGTENVTLGLMPDDRMHDQPTSKFSCNNSYLQTASSIPSACSAFSTLQHSSPANNVTASDILYQTHELNPNASQQGQWNHINTHHYNYQSVELPTGDGDTFSNRSVDQGLNNLQSWNPLTSGVATSSDQMQTVINNLTIPRQQILQYQPQQYQHPQNYSYDQIISENNIYDARPTNHNEGYMNHNTELDGTPQFFERRDGHSDFRNCQISNYNSNAEYQNNLMELQEGVHMLESISANIPDCDMINSSHAGLAQRSNPGNLLTMQEPEIPAEMDNFPKSASGQMQYFQPLNVKEHFETRSKNRRGLKTSKIKGGIHNEQEYMDFLNEVIYKENQGSFDHTLQPLQPKDVDKDKFYCVFAPILNPAEVNDIGHNCLIARYIDYLIVENEQITEMSKSVSIPIEHCVMDDPYLMDIIGVKVHFPTAKYYQWLHTFCPNIPIDWKSLNRQMMRFQQFGDYRQHNFLIDKRPTPVLLGESFYFFQRERDRLLQC